MELCPEVPASSKSESPLINESALGSAHLSQLIQGEVEMSVIEVEVPILEG